MNRSKGVAMGRFRAWLIRLSEMFHRKQSEQELSQELESHLQMHIQDNLHAGMAPQEARRQALLKLGGLDQTKELYRDRRGLPFLEILLHDLRFAFRTLGKKRGFATTAILTLAIGIGANTAIFSLVNSVLLRPLSYKDPQQLYLIREIVPQWAKSAPFGCESARLSNLAEAMSLFRTNCHRRRDGCGSERC